MSENTHTITILLSQVGQQAALIAGQPAQEQQEYEVGVDLVPALLKSGAGIGADGLIHVKAASLIYRAAYGYPGAEGGWAHGWTRFDKRPADAGEAVTLLGLKIAAVRGEKERQEAEAEAARKHRGVKELEQRRQMAREWLIRPEVAPWADLPELQELAATLAQPEGDPGTVQYGGHSAEKAVLAASAAAEKAAYLAELRSNAERAAAQKAENWNTLREWRKSADKAVRRLRELAEAECWASEHGSPRLRRCLQEEIECLAIYRDERLAAERPGWRWETEVDGSGEEPRNPPQEALDLLDRARETDSEAELNYWTVEHEHDSEYDDECSRYAWEGYTVEAEFLGRFIIFGGPAE